MNPNREPNDEDDDNSHGLVYNIQGYPLIFLEDQWFLNEEKIFVSEEDSALRVASAKINSLNNKKKALIDESYSVEQTIKIIKKHNNKVTRNLLESCLTLALSKSITNRADVLELRKFGSTIANKYIFEINQELVALSESDMDTLQGLSDDVVQQCSNSDDLYNILVKQY
jgi:hypothetical protein